jgi:hypothetical protein
LKTNAKRKAIRNGLLVFVTAYRKIATDTGARNHQFKGAKPPERTIPEAIAKTRLTI